MADRDNLPLIPGKSAVCSDVKPVLREVFREIDQLPPLALEKTSATDDEKLWIEKYNSECEEFWHQEGDLKKEFATRMLKKPPQNLYTLYKPSREKQAREGPGERGLLGRKDFMPGIEQIAAGDQTLWVQNILNRSSCEISVKEKPITKLATPLKPVGLEKCSRQTFSVGELRVQRALTSPPEPHEPPMTKYIYCVPHQINFVNFNLGQTYTKQVRLVNASKFEIRLSVSLPRRRELEIELSRTRGLRVTAGSATELKINFRPKDARTLHDKLHIRTSLGKGLIVPIACYMEPPELHIIVQKMNTSYGSDTVEISGNRGNIVDLGTKLLGEEHCAAITLKSDAAHASFFLLTEDAWFNWTVKELTADGSLKSCPFTIHPAWWAGGGVTRGTVRCRATTTGFYKTDLRILSSTAVTKSLHVIADSVYFSPDHISVEAQEKDFDITSDGDPECEYYVHLGTAFPNRPLSAMVQIVNHSAMPYSFYWQFRPWGITSTRPDDQHSKILSENEEESNCQVPCSGVHSVNQSHQKLNDDKSDASVCRVRLEPEAGSVRELRACAVRVHVPEAGTHFGTHRAVLLLVLKDIPIESFAPKFTPKLVSTRTVEETGPDGKVWSRKLCDILQAQIEVWWEVVPVRFMLDPPVLCFIHSRRVKEVTVSLLATQLCGRDAIPTCWASKALVNLPRNLLLCPHHSIEATLKVPLPPLPNENPETNHIALKTEMHEWAAHCYITQACATRHPALTPARFWLGVVPPGTKMSVNMEVFNDTLQNISWYATPYRWVGENPPNKSCADADRTCDVCHERTCTCSLLNPRLGALECDQGSTIHYNVFAPTTDCCVATLVRVTRRPSPDVAVTGGPGTEARATLIAYRVLAPRLVLRVFPCGGDKKGECRVCDLDLGEKPGGCTVLRPCRALSLGSCSCYRLRITNITPVATAVRWEPPIDGEEFLKVKFLPNSFSIGSYTEKEISVILEPRKVCGRRLYVLRAHVAHAPKPLYLLIDTAIDGVQIVCEVPLGGSERNDSFVALRGIQKEIYPWSDGYRPTTPEEWFLEEDRKRAVVQENKCNCHFEMIYIPPIKPLQPPRGEDETPPPTEILTSPPSLTRVCECFGKTMPIVPEHKEPCCLQFRNVPLKTVKTRRLTLRNVGQVTARWRVVVRRWPRQRNHAAAAEALANGKDRWAGDVLQPGVVIQCSPDKGICTAGQNMDMLVQVYADCWGLYYDQIMLMVDHLDPIVVDVWIEAVGPPLQFATAPSCSEPEFDSAMWLSAYNPERTLRVKNTSRSQLTVHAYTLLEHEHSQEAYPFRLYIQFKDNLPLLCPCVTFSSSDSYGISEESSSTALSQKTKTGIDLYLAEDYGIENEEYYRVEPQTCTVAAGAWMEWRVTLNPTATAEGEAVPPGLVLLRTVPDDNKGDYWQRCEPPPRRVGVRTAPRAPTLNLSCKRAHVLMCALELPYNQTARIRKRFRVRNIGTAPLSVRCVTSLPWQIVMNKPKRDCDECGCEHELGERYDEVQMLLEPWSSTAIVMNKPKRDCNECGCEHELGERYGEVQMVLEPWRSTAMCIEVSIDTEEVSPKVEEAYSKDCMNKTRELPTYATVREICGELAFYGGQELLETLPLILEVQFPKLSIEPAAINFGFITHGDTRKTYFTVWHSSMSTHVDLTVSWQGNAQLRIYPRFFRVAPRERARVYILYTAEWKGAPMAMEGNLIVSAAAGAWCRCVLSVRAQPARDSKFHKMVHDHTDQWNLWPPFSQLL